MSGQIWLNQESFSWIGYI